MENNRCVYQNIKTTEEWIGRRRTFICNELYLTTAGRRITIETAFDLAQDRKLRMIFSPSLFQRFGKT